MKLRIITLFAVICILLTLCSCGNRVSTEPTVSGVCEECGETALLYECWDNGNSVNRLCDSCADEWVSGKKIKKDKNYTRVPATQETALTVNEVVSALKGSWTVTTDGESYEWAFAYSTADGGNSYVLKINNPVSGNALYTGEYEVNAPARSILFTTAATDKSDGNASEYSLYLTYTVTVNEDGDPVISLSDSLGSTFTKNN